MKARDAYAGLDRGALEAWASPGLVAHVEGAGLEASVESETQEELQLRVEEARVTLTAEGLPAAWCSCPAWGPCRHVVAAVRALLAASAVEDRPAADPLAGVTAEVIRAWAGATAYLDGWRLLLAGVQVDVQVQGARLLASIPDLEAEVVLLPGDNLSGLVVAAAPRSAKRLGALGLIAALRTRGPLEPPPEVGRVDLRGAAGAARTPAQILAATQDILRQMVAVGLCHLSEASAERLFTASVAAHAAKLVRLGKALDHLADEVNRQLRRDAAADEARLFSAMADAYALCAALEAAGDDAPEGLVGRARARYVDVPRLHLAALGARALVTDSGLVGLSAVFRDLANQRWLTMADVRPAAQMPGFSPRSAYRAHELWGETSFAELMGKQIEVEQARVSDDGRLSASAQTRATVLGPAPRRAIEGLEVDDFEALRATAQAAFPLGLTPPAPHARLCVLAPAGYAPAVFDGPSQTLRWAMLDREARRVEVLVRHGPHQARLIEALEAWRPAPGARVLAELSGAGSTVRAHVVAALTPGPEGLIVFSPSLDERRGPRRPAPADEEGPSGAPRVHPVLEAAKEGLAGWAERGLMAPPDASALDAEAMLQAGFRSLADAVARLVGAPSPHRLLVARYVLRLSLGAAART